MIEQMLEVLSDRINACVQVQKEEIKGFGHT